ncbi:hypothetical protein AK812_SmicGene29147 [Symbiodinium microadriaticum]|uniref:Uncharacterized protein n=1 Tax=Symbiodinium microadriaticum TaxID=2951 RepID=A0A1Q9D2K6_SYMMI|nr:hypothetical protein AK812_SmicGene29147 [Symbiodinium microadriaticum]
MASSEDDGDEADARSETDIDELAVSSGFRKPAGCQKRRKRMKMLGLGLPLEYLHSIQDTEANAARQAGDIPFDMVWGDLLEGDDDGDDDDDDDDDDDEDDDDDDDDDDDGDDDDDDEGDDGRVMMGSVMMFMMKEMMTRTRSRWYLDGFGLEGPRPPVGRAAQTEQRRPACG